MGASTQIMSVEPPVANQDSNHSLDYYVGRNEHDGGGSEPTTNPVDRVQQQNKH